MELLEGIPDVLYKYRCWDNPFHKRVLTHNELFLSSADMFNDPFDAALPMRYDSDDLTRDNVIKKLLITGREMWPEISSEELQRRAEDRYKTGGFDKDEYWKNHHKNFKERLNKDYGICSLTSHSDNILMWSHYANAHTGFCVGFDTAELYKTIQGMIGPVIYEDTFPIIPLFPKTDASDELIMRLTVYLITKSKHWQYEDEYRITKTFAARKTFILNDSSIKEVILGCKMNGSDKSEIIDLVKGKASKIKIYDSVINDSKFKLNLIEII